jgi:Ni,Fe-hydrogenase I cytochrome b subunit
MKLYGDYFFKKSTVIAVKNGYVREKLWSSFYTSSYSEGVSLNSLFFHFLTKKEGQGIHRELLETPAPL